MSLNRAVAEKVLECLAPIVGTRTPSNDLIEKIELTRQDRDDGPWVSVSYASAFDGARQNFTFLADPDEWGWDSLRDMLVLDLDELESERVGKLKGWRPPPRDRPPQARD